MRQKNIHSGQTSRVTQGPDGYSGMHTCWVDRQTDIENTDRPTEQRLKELHSISYRYIKGGCIEKKSGPLQE